MNELLVEAARRGANYIQSLDERRVFPEASAINRLKDLEEHLPEIGHDSTETLQLLDEIGSPATVASAGGRYFGFVTGSSLPAARAANILAVAWDQNAGLEVMSPVAAFLEGLAAGWLVDVFGLPEGTGVGFTSGATMANLSCLAAARHAVLTRVGWDVEARGLFGAPEISVIVSDEVHASMLKALALLGFGRERVRRVPTDQQGRMRSDAIPPIHGPTILCVQAGNVNTGAFDPPVICRRARQAGAWVHVDGAFGLWAAAAPGRKFLVEGIEDADSWATDAHKWLNVPYDSGLAFVRSPRHLNASMSSPAAYLVEGEKRDGLAFVPEMSRRARGIEIWAALHSLGRRGLAEMIERNCSQAQRMASGLQDAGYKVLNDIVLNQVLVSFGDSEQTRQVITALQAEGTCWCGGTVWQDQTAMRISFSSWATTDEDVRRCLDAIVRVAAGIRNETLV